MDTLPPDRRSEIMSRIKGKNTKPEMRVRSLLHSMGFRFRLHRKDLPGKPDIILPKWKTAVFVHGCFWHGHDCPRGSRPSSNIAFWAEKIRKNQERDRTANDRLRDSGWTTMVIWECELRDIVTLRSKLKGIAATHA